MSPALFGFLQLPELIVIGIVALLVFGKRLPDVARSLGRGVVEFKRGLRDIEEDVEKGATAQVSAAAPKAITATPAAKEPLAPEAVEAPRAEVK